MLSIVNNDIIFPLLIDRQVNIMKFLSICANPCIDMTVRVDELKLGGLNRIDRAIYNHSGKGVNVAAVASRLGARAVMAGFMGSVHENAYKARLAADNIESRFVMYDGEVRTNIKLYEETGRFTEINMAGEAVSEAMIEELLRTVEKELETADVVTMSGSLPPGCPRNIYGQIIEMADRMNVPSLLDTEGGPLLGGIEAGPTVIKPNLYELEKAAGTALADSTQIIDGARKICGSRVKWALVSCGGDGAYLIGADEAYYGKAPKIKALTTTGAGDSMAAAACIAMLEGAGPEDVLASGIAAGSATCLSEGTKLLNPHDYTELKKQIRIGSL